MGVVPGLSFLSHLNELDLIGAIGVNDTDNTIALQSFDEQVKHK